MKTIALCANMADAVLFNLHVEDYFIAAAIISGEYEVGQSPREIRRKRKGAVDPRARTRRWDTVHDHTNGKYVRSPRDKYPQCADEIFSTSPVSVEEISHVEPQPEV